MAHATTNEFPSSGASVSLARAWWSVFVLMLLLLLAFLDRQLLSLMVGPIKADLGISDFQIGLLQGFSFALFYAVFGLPFGWAVDHFPRRHIILGGLTIWSFAASACGLAQQFWHLLLARFGVGSGEAALYPASFSILADIFPPHRLALALSVFGAGAVIGGAAALAVGGLIIDHVPAGGLDVPLLGEIKAWQFVFLVTGLPGLLLGWLVYTIPEPARGRSKPVREAGQESSGTGSFRSLLGQRRRFYAGHILGFGFNSLASYGLILWTPAYLSRRFGWGAAEIGGWIAATHIAAGLVGGVLVGWIVDRWYAAGRRDAHLRFYAWAGLVQVVLICTAVSMPSPYLFLLFDGISFLFAPFTGVAAAALQIVTPAAYRGRASAFYLFIFTIIGLGLGPTIVASFTDFLFADDRMVGWSIALTFLIFLPLSALSLLLACKPMRQWAEQEYAVDRAST